MSFFRPLVYLALLGGTAAMVGAVARPAQAQGYRFTLRAEPDVIPANGISTTSLFVQVPQSGGAISMTPVVRFATTLGVIESTAQLSGGVARVLLRSSTTPGTAVVTAFVGSSRESVAVEFTNDAAMVERYLEVSAPYVAYGSNQGVVTASGKTVLDFGETQIQSDTRLDVDLFSERVWAQGNVTIRHGSGAKSATLRGDRLYYDLRRRRGVMRRADTTDAPARQEFVGSAFLPPASSGTDDLTLAGGDKPEDRIMSPGLEPTLAPEVLPEADASAVTPESKKGSPLASPTSVFKLPVGPQSRESRGGEAEAATNPDAPAAGDPAGQETRSTALVAVPRLRDGAAGVEAPLTPPPFAPLGSVEGPAPLIVEMPPPTVRADKGYWVSARRLRVFPRDKIQFERAAIFFNGGKVYRAPLYVLPLDGSFNPTTDTLSFTSAGGARLKFPVSYQASDRGTGTLFLRHEPSAGFSSENSGFSLALNQQYWLSPRAHGSVDVDSIGNGAWNLNLRHSMQFNPTTSANLYVSSPQHRDIFARSSIVKQFRAMQVGLETTYDRPRDAEDNIRAQFFARMRPKILGRSGWSYSTSANLLAVRRTNYTVVRTVGGGGVGLPGQNNPGTTTLETLTRPLVGQTLTASFQSPSYSPWRSSALTANLFASAYNYSDGRRGVSPGLTMGLSQNVGQKLSLQLNYTYDRSAIGLYGATTDSFTHYVSGALNAQVLRNVALSGFVSKSLSDESLYGSTDLNYRISSKWRTGLFADYSSFTSDDSTWNYGWSLGRKIGLREVSINYDAVRDKIYFELGNARY